jgi:hypothetical protein
MVPKFMVDKIARKMMDDTGVSLKKYMQTARISAAGPAARPAAAKEARPRRAKRILRVVKTSTGYRLWLLGRTYNVAGHGI